MISVTDILGLVRSGAKNLKGKGKDILEELRKKQEEERKRREKIRQVEEQKKEKEDKREKPKKSLKLPESGKFDKPVPLGERNFLGTGVGLRDINRELGLTTRKFLGEAAQDIPRSAVSLKFQAQKKFNELQPNKAQPTTFQPKTQAEQLLLGKRKIKPAGEEGKELLESFGAGKEKQEKFGAPTGIALAGLALTPGGAPKKVVKVAGTLKYLDDLAKQQKVARSVERAGVFKKITGTWAEFKKTIVDSAAPIEDALYPLPKQLGDTLTPHEQMNDSIGRVLRHRSLATQFTKDNGLERVIRDAPNLDYLNQYLIAKHTPDVATKTGRNVKKDAQLLKDLADEYEPFAQEVIQYGRKLLDKAVNDGLVNKKTANALKLKYPNYIPLNRIFSEIEKTVPQGVSGIANISKQTIIQKLKGSGRAIENPIDSMLNKTLDVFAQGERNKAGRLLARFGSTPNNSLGIKEVSKAGADNTFSVFQDGVKKTYSAPEDVASAAKLLDKQQLGAIGQIVALPVRIARVGITGINPSFLAGNLAKDQATAFINSSKPLRTSIANPEVFLRSAWNAIGRGKEYDNWIRAGGGGTVFDIARNAPTLTTKRLRSKRNPVSNVLYTVSHPKQLLRAVEDVVARGEEMTRLQQFIGTRESLLKEGKSMRDATILAAKQSREATVDFARSGDWGKVMNNTLLYFGSSIQGSRTLVRNLKTRPKATALKIGISTFTPMAAITAWNMKDEKRKAAYDDIQEWEKENNFIIVPPNPVKDDRGKWNVIKIPLSQEVASLADVVRKGIESLHGEDAPGFGDFAQAIIGSSTGLNVQSPNALIGQFTPQAVKPPIQSVINKDLFTGRDIVPKYIGGAESKYLPAEEQVRDDTSGTTRIVGKLLGVSPIKVEHALKTTAGEASLNVLNAIDSALAITGAIPEEQVGGRSIPESFARRFSEASGGELLSKQYDEVEPYKEAQAQETVKARKLSEEIYSKYETMPPDEFLQYKNELKKQGLYTKSIKTKVKNIRNKKKLTESERVIDSLSNKQKAQYILDKFYYVLPEEEWKPLYKDMKKSGLINDSVKKNMNNIFKEKKANEKISILDIGKVTAFGSPFWSPGLDIDLKIGDAIPSPVNGKITFIGKNGGFGNQVRVKGKDGNEYWLSHLSDSDVRLGDAVSKGQTIAMGGNSGRVIRGRGGDGSHLDITVKDKNGKLLSARQVYQLLSTV